MGLTTRIVAPCLLLTALVWKCESNCPPDTAARARQCFTNFTWGVAPSDDDNGLNDILNGGGEDSLDSRGIHQGSGAGSVSERVSGATVPLDYRKIREYCAEGGHMFRFVHCVEELSQYCPDLPPGGAFGQLINPQRVRTSVPELCSSKDAIEEKSECMNNVMNQRSPCKERAFNSILPSPSRSIFNGNGSQASFFMQCRYLSILAECQRTVISETCGGHLGNLHANFLLSFVPAFCNPHAPPGAGLPPGHRKPHGSGLRKGPGHRSELPKTGGVEIGRKRSWDPRGTNGSKEGYVESGMQEGTHTGEGPLSNLKMPDNAQVQPGAGTSAGDTPSLDQDSSQQTETGKPSDRQTIPMSTLGEHTSRITGPISGAVVQEVTSSTGEMTSEGSVASTKSYVSNSMRRPRNTSRAAAVVIRQDTFPMASTVVASLCLVFCF